MLKRGISTLVKECSPYTVTTYARPDNVVLSRGKGSYLWDTTDKKYVDFTAGIAVTGLGHSDDGVSQIIADQASTLMHSSNLYYNEWTLKLSKSLVEKTLSSGAMPSASKAFVANSGTEANEAALKFARKVGTSHSPDKTELVSFQRGFHGRTMGALSVTANPKYQAPFNPLIPGVKTATVNDYASLDQITDKTCGVIVEPIQGEGGVYECNQQFLQALRAKCDQHGAVLIFDEIQCGMGRTGKLWAHSHGSVAPDVLTTAKALGNGFPISATLVNDKVESVLKVGDHGTTYGGNPLGCRVADYVLNQLTQPELMTNVDRISSLFQTRFQKWQSEHPNLVQEVRGRGLLLGLQLSTDPSPIVKRAMESGLLVITCGTNTLRFVPALNISEHTANEGLDILEHCINKE